MLKHALKHIVALNHIFLWYTCKKLILVMSTNNGNITLHSKNLASCFTFHPILSCVHMLWSLKYTKLYESYPKFRHYYNELYGGHQSSLTLTPANRQHVGLQHSVSQLQQEATRHTQGKVWTYFPQEVWGGRGTNQVPTYHFIYLNFSKNKF